MIRVSGESKSKLVKAAGAESSGQRRNQKLHAAVARSTFPSQNLKKLTVSEHFSLVSQFVNLSARQLDSSIHQCFCSAICESQQPISPIGFLFLKLPPSPCAVLRVSTNKFKDYIFHGHKPKQAKTQIFTAFPPGFWVLDFGFWDTFWTLHKIR